MKRVDMSRTWYSSKSIKTNHKLLPITQVYCWLINRSKIIIVSKDGRSWQLPGGKPEKTDLTLMDTAIREIKEETGINISEHRTDIEFLGYYRVIEGGHEYLQARVYILGIPHLPKSLIVSENLSQKESERIKFAKSVSINQATKAIPWLKQSSEYLELIKLGVINDGQ